MTEPQTRRSRELRKAKLSGILWDQERKDSFYKKGLEHLPEIKQYKMYEALPEIEKYNLVKAWDEYYLAAQKSTAARRYFTMGEAWRLGDMSTVKQLAEDAKYQLANREWELKKPSIHEPALYEHGDLYIKYRATRAEYESLKKGSDFSPEDAFL